MDSGRGRYGSISGGVTTCCTTLSGCHAFGFDSSQIVQIDCIRLILEYTSTHSTFVPAVSAFIFQQILDRLMLCSSTQHLPPAIYQWEKARDALDIAMTKYLDLCCSLGASSLRQGTSTTDLSTRIGFALETFHVKLEQHTTRARSILADTQNQLMSPIYRVPREILSEIFAHVIYSDAWSGYFSMLDTLMGHYFAVYHLLGVCSAWRTIILARGSFWSIIPIMKQNVTSHFGIVRKHPCSTSLSLERAGAGDLHLAVVSQDPATDVANDLTQFAPRFRTINIIYEAHSVIHHILDNFRDYGSLNRLTELSIFHQSRRLNEIPQESDYVFLASDPRQQLFERVVKSLSILRIRGAVFQLHTALSCSQLVELHLQDITLGHDSKFIEILGALSSVPTLRSLKFISIITFLENEAIPIATNSSISLPTLQTLFIQDLYANTLRLLFSLISFRTHHTTLYLTGKCLQVQHPGENEPEAINIQELVGIAGFSYVNTLMVNSVDNLPMSAKNLRAVIGLMRNLETLHMVWWQFNKESCEALTRPQNPSSSSFPRIKHIHLYSVMIENTNWFTTMVASHSESLEQMIFGGGMEKTTYGPLEWEDLEEEDEIVVWLEQNVPKFKHIGWSYEPPESYVTPEWHLW